MAGRVNNQVVITPTADLTSNTAAVSTHSVLRVAAAITSQPLATSVSLVNPSLFPVLASTLDSDFIFADATDPGLTLLSTATTTAGTSSVPTSINYSTRANKSIAGSDKTLATLTFTPTLVGTYKVVIWNETSTSGTPASAAQHRRQSHDLQP